MQINRSYNHNFIWEKEDLKVKCQENALFEPSKSYDSTTRHPFLNYPKVILLGQVQGPNTTQNKNILEHDIIDTFNKRKLFILLIYFVILWY